MADSPGDFLTGLFVVGDVKISVPVIDNVAAFFLAKLAADKSRCCCCWKFSMTLGPMSCGSGEKRGPTKAPAKIRFGGCAKRTRPSSGRPGAVVGKGTIPILRGKANGEFSFR